MAEAKEQKPAPKKIKVEPVFGPMVDLVTDQRIDGVTEVPAIHGWLQAQIDAGKLRLCS